MEFSRNGVQFHCWWFNPLLCRHNELTTKPMDLEYGRPCMLGHVLPRRSEWHEGGAPLWIQGPRAYWALTSSSGYCHLHICPTVKQKVNCFSDFVCTDSEGGSPQPCSWLTVRKSIMGQPSFTAGIWSKGSFWGLSFTWSTAEGHVRVILEGRRWRKKSSLQGSWSNSSLVKKTYCFLQRTHVWGSASTSCVSVTPVPRRCDVLF